MKLKPSSKKATEKVETKKQTIHQKVESYINNAQYFKEDLKYFQHKIENMSEVVKLFVHNFQIPGHTLFYNTKVGTKKARKEYGYFINDRTTLFTLIKVLNIKGLVDLGCGAGVAISCLDNFQCRVKGYDNEPDLVNIANKISHNKNLAEVKDITKLTKEDIKDFAAVYFWEPIIDEKMATKFVKNLLKVMKKDQYIFYYSSGKIGELLQEYGVKKGIISEPEYYNEITIYQKIK